MALLLLSVFTFAPAARAQLCVTPLDCDDGDPCTVDACDTVTGCSNDDQPRSSCLTELRSKFGLHDDPLNDEDDYLRWTWRRGAEFPPEAIGSPRTSTTYALCIYDQVAASPSLVASFGVPPDLVLWGVRNGRAEYVDRTGSQDGIRKLRLRSGAQSKTKVQFGASGLPLDVPPAADPDFHFRVDPEVIVQLVNSEGHCWTSSYGRDEVLTNRSRNFRAAAKAP